ncbi:MAG: hypothetical protein ACOC0Z_05115 [Halohasta sp.]
MNARQLITITVAALFLIGGMAAVGAAAPAEQAPETPSDAESNTEDVDSTDDEPAANATDGVGPSDGLPEQVPDHVGSIHETITAFQNDEVDNLGESLSSLLGGGPADDAGASNA